MLHTSGTWQRGLRAAAQPGRTKQESTEHVWRVTGAVKCLGSGSQQCKSEGGLVMESTGLGLPWELANSCRDLQNIFKSKPEEQG